MFRREKPQKGRYRQFHQMSVEALGFAEPGDRRRADRVVRAAVARARTRRARSSSSTRSGRPSRARQYKQVLVEHFSRHRELLDEDSLRRLERNPLRILDSKNPELRELIDAAPLLVGPSRRRVARALRARAERCSTTSASRYTLNPRLVRGLDYYSRTVFEWVTDRLGAQSAVCSGGRYDGLVAQLGGRDTPAVGWALGIERIVELMQAEGIGAARGARRCAPRRGRRGRAPVRLQARRSSCATGCRASGSRSACRRPGSKRSCARADKSGARVCR